MSEIAPVLARATIFKSQSTLFFSPSLLRQSLFQDLNLVWIYNVSDKAIAILFNIGFGLQKVSGQLR